MKICIVSLLFFIAIGLNSEAGEILEKTKVYQKFFEVTGAESQYEQMVNIMISQFQEGFGTSLRGALEKVESADTEEKSKFTQMADQSMGRFLKRLKEEMENIMPFKELAKNVYIPVYAKYFRLEEIEKITAFYESAVGKKFVSVSPALMQESMILVNQKYTPKLQEIGADVAQKEFSELGKEIEKLMKSKQKDR